MPNLDKIRGTLLGTAIGDALGMPVEGLSHQNVRMYYRGIKGYTDDEKRRDLHAGQWTDDTQFTFALVRAFSGADSLRDVPGLAAREFVDLIPQARRWGPTSRTSVERLKAGWSVAESGDSSSATNGAVMRAAPLGVWWAVSRSTIEEAFVALRPFIELTHWHPDSIIAAFGQCFAVSRSLHQQPPSYNRDGFWMELIEVVDYVEKILAREGRLISSAVSKRLRTLSDHLDDFPLDLQDLCDGTGFNVDQSWPFAAAMFARNPQLLEATLLSSINVGGDSDTIGAMVGSLLGAYHGWSAFPEVWRRDLEMVDQLLLQSDIFANKIEYLVRKQ